MLLYYIIMSQVDKWIQWDNQQKQNAANDAQYIENVKEFAQSLGYSQNKKLEKSLWSQLRANGHYKLARVLDHQLDIVDFMSAKNAPTHTPSLQDHNVVICSVCGGHYIDTKSDKKQHESTKKHKQHLGGL